jgi:dTDP-glucose 4,6-dehydratase
VTRRPRRVLVTGGAGFIGSNFVHLLARERPDVEVTVLDKLTYAGNPANLEGLDVRFVQGDICDRDLVDGLAAAQDAIVNFAAESHVDRSLLDPFAFVQTDTQGVAVLCEAARKHAHEVFLHVSTDEVYGEVRAGRSREEDPLRPRSPYSASKAGGEHLAMAYHVSFGLPVVITRGSNTYGPRQFPEKLIPVLVTNALDGLPLPLYNDGTAVRDYLHVEDHCRAIDLVLQRGAPGQAYNVGTGVETSGNELAAMVREAVGTGEIQYVADRPGHDYRYALDSGKIEEQLGWRAQVALREGLIDTIRWYREHEDWWRPLRSAEYWDYYRRNYRPLGASSGA